MRARRARLASTAAVLLAVGVCMLSNTHGVLAQAPGNAMCPERAETGKTIVLSSADGRRAEVTWLDADRTKIVEQNDASRSFPRETISVHGLIATELTRPSGKVRVAYDTSPETLFPLSVGHQRQIGFAADVEGGEPIKGRVTIAAVEALKHVIGECSYDAVLVGAQIEFDDGKQAPVRYDVYIPSLQAVAKSTTFDAATNTILEAETFEFDYIAAK